MDELLTDFLTETVEGLTVLDSELVRLEQEPNDPTILGNIFRVMHTIKGTCGFLGLPRLEAVAHAGENVLGKIRDGKLHVTPHTITLILEAIDCIKTILSYLENEGKEPSGDDGELIQRLNACAEGEEPVAEAMPEPAAPAAIAEVIEGDLPVEQSAEEVAESLAIFDEILHQNDEVPTEPEHHAEEQAAEPEPAPAPINVPAPIAHAAAPASTIVDPIMEGLKAKAAEPGNKSTPVSNQTIRVNLEVLENLMQMVSELVLTRNQLFQVLRTNHNVDFAAPLQRLNHITSELQERVMKTRMQPISNAWTPFPRLIRDLALELNKKIELRQIGGDTELDRQLLEMIKDPLTHMVRNSADHGLEGPEERRNNGKPETGTVTLRAYHEGGYIIVEIADDGRGLNPQKIMQKAIANGLATEQELAQMSEQQILQFIFRAGFSTAEKVTSVSGRGVGMDVVKNNIEKISGTIELISKVNKGSTFRIKIPLTLAIMQVLIVEAGGKRFAIPQINITELVRCGQNGAHQIEYINDRPILRLRGKLLPLITLVDVMKITLETPSNPKFIAVCEVGGFQFGVLVDRVFDTEEIVVKPTSPVLKHLDIYSGSTILGDGSVIMILDPNGMARCTGEVNMTNDTSNALSQHIAADDIPIRFLIFNAGGTTPKALPLDLVSRLEEIDVSKIEFSGDQRVIQYRNNLMYLTAVDPDYVWPESGMQHVVVFMDNNKVMGLAVKEIVDIVEHSMSISSKLEKPGFLGSVVIDSRTCDLVDIGYFFKQTFASTAIADDSINNAPRVLFVDDSPFFRKFIPPTLQEAGYRVTTFDNARDALTYMENDNRFSAIITDMNMPGMDGMELARHCQDNQRLSHIPIVVLSSQSMDELHQFKQGVNAIQSLKAYVSKTNHTQLLDTIAGLMAE